MSSPETNNGERPRPNWRTVRREQRYERRYERSAWRGRSAAWVSGLVLVAVGGIFLAGNLGLDVPEHGWALFLLIPAVAALGRAAGAYRANGGHLDGTVGAALSVGVMFLALTLIFLLGADWGTIGPVLLIVVGLGVLLRGMVASRH